MEQRYYYFKLNPALQKTYDRFYHALSCRTARFDGESLSPAQISELLHLILLDQPRLCYFEGKWGYQNGICPIYTLSSSQVMQLSDAADSLLNDTLVFADSNPRELVRIIYDWFLANVVYDPYAPHSQSSYGALVERRALCKGISKAFQLLLHKLEIPCILVEGTLDKHMKHVWNMVEIDGMWLHVDVCMGYPSFYPLIGTQDRYSCFCADSKTIRKSHQIYHPHLLPTEVQS